MDQLAALMGNRRGSATVLALMVSMLLMVLVMATMALTIIDVQTSQDFVRNKKTFQAADSGIVHADATLAHALGGLTLASSTTPQEVTDFADQAEAGVRESNADLSLLVTAGPNFESILPRNEVSTSSTLETNESGLAVDYDASLDITPVSVDRPDGQDTSLQHVFHYSYEISSEGEANISGQHNQATRRETGTFDVEVERPSFATYGYFTQSAKNQFNSQLWFYDGEVYGGPTHVNSAPPTGQVAFWGQPTFNGPFSAVQETYEESLFGGNADPVFNDSQAWGVDPITLPENGWSQLRAAIGEYENIGDTSAPTNAELREVLGLPVSDEAVDKGVYYAANYNTGTDLLGGIFINGNANTITLDADGDNQVITVTQHNYDGGEYDGEHSWVFTENKAYETVSVVCDGGTPQTFSGSLNGMIHTEGQVNGLYGDSTLDGADIESSQEITISATGNIYVQNHITYESDPATYPDAINIFGIFSSEGNIFLGRNAPNNLHLDATVMATGAGHGIGAEGIVSAGRYDYYYPNKGNWYLTGGLIENTNQTTGVFYSNGHVTGYTWAFTYDERFLSGAAPPYFPYVTKFVVTMLGIDAQSWGRKYY